MTEYDPNVAPDPQTWLSMNEVEQESLVTAYHSSEPMPWDARMLHVGMHATIENQLAAGEPAPVAAMARLQSGGLGRHECIHALAAVLSGVMFDAVRGSAPPDGDLNSVYAEALTELTVESWRAQAE